MARQAVMPPFAYYGGKTTLAPTIARLLPPHTHYVEPFAGSLAVLLAKRPAPMETVNDLDGDLVLFWRVLRERPDELVRAAALTPHSREEHVLAKDLDSAPDELERARRIWVRLTQNRSHSMTSTGWWFGRAAGAGSARSIVKSLDTFVSRIPPAAERLRGVSLECRDGLDVIRDYGVDPGICIYADPPYLRSTRESTNYRVEMADDDSHTALAETLNGCRASVVLSGYDSPLYAELFPGWHRTELRAPTRLGGTPGPAEVLWSNVPLGAQGMFDWSGDDVAGDVEPPLEEELDVELDGALA